MYLMRKNGSTSNVIRRVLRSSASGQGLTGLTFASSGLIISTICDNEASATVYTAAGSTIETIATLGTFAAPTATKCRFKEVDATNHPGLYEFQFADARFSVSSAKTLRVTISGAASLIQQEVVIQLTSVDVDDGTAFGVSRIDATISSRSTLAGTAQTGDAFARLGTNGAGLTALGDTRLANLDAAVSSRSTYAGGAVASVTGAVGSVTADVGITQAGADKVWGSAARTLTGFGTLVADIATAVWAAASRTLTAFGFTPNVGNVSDARLANLDAAVSTRLATAGYTAPDNTDIVTILADAVTLLARNTPLDAAGVRTALGMASANLDTQLTEANADLDEIITSLAAIQTITLPVATVTGTPTSTSVQVTGLTETTTNAYRDGYFLLQTGTHQFTVPSPISASSYSGGTTTLTFATPLVVVPSAGDAALIIGSKRSS